MKTVTLLSAYGKNWSAFSTLTKIIVYSLFNINPSSSSVAGKKNYLRVKK